MSPPKTTTAEKPHDTTNRRAAAASQPNLHDAAPEQALGNRALGRVLGTDATNQTDAPEKRPANQGPRRGGARLVEDSEVADAGQMTKSDFLAATRMSIEAASDRALASTGRTSRNCPWIQRGLDYYEARSAASLERALLDFAPEATGGSARDYVAAVTARVERSVRHWVRTGEITGAPIELPAVMATKPLQIQLKAASDGGQNGNPGEVQERLGGGRALPGDVRGRMESAFGTSFGGVRLHDDGASAGVATELGARALTVGQHVAFAAGEFRPNTIEGDALLAHELAHVVQQKNGDARVDGKSPGSTGALEKDADASAVAAVTSLWTRDGTSAAGVKARVLPSLQSGLRVSRCTEEPGTTEKAPPEKQPKPPVGTGPTQIPSTQPSTAPSTQPSTAPTAAPSPVSTVKSLAIQDQKTAIASKWKLVKKKRDLRAGALGLTAKLTAPETAALASMKARFTDLSTLLDDPAFDPVAGALPSGLAGDVAAEKADAAKFGSKGTVLKGQSAEFTDEISAFLKLRTTQTEETSEFARFDGPSFFTHPDVLTLLAAIQPAGLFTVRELKAQLARETGDFTRIKVAGLEGKKSGIKSTKIYSAAGIVGVGQFSEAARSEAIGWAAANNVTIPASPDPRLDPLLSMKLAAAGLGFNTDYIRKVIGSKTVSNADLRRIVWATYNAGPTVIRDKVKSINKTTITWADVDAALGYEETRTYVKEIESRL